MKYIVRIKEGLNIEIGDEFPLDNVNTPEEAIESIKDLLCSVVNDDIEYEVEEVK